MTVSSETTRNDYTGNGVTTVFAYSFRIWAESDLLVVQADADGVETVLELTTDYTVSGVGNTTGGDVTLLSALASGHKLAILSAIPALQGQKLSSQGGFNAAVQEASLDKLTRMVQQDGERLDRALVLPITSEEDGESLAESFVQSVSVAEAAASSASASAASAARWAPKDPMDYGAAGDGVADDTTIINSVLSTGGIVKFSAIHRVTGAVNIPSATHIEFKPGAEIVCDTATAGFRITGSLGTLRTLAANATRGDLTVTVGTGIGANFSAGQVVWIQAEDDALEYVGHKKAEIAIVDSVSGDVITLEGPILDDYTTANTAKIGIITTVTDVTIQRPRMRSTLYSSAPTTSTYPFIYATFARDLVIDGKGRLYENNGAGVLLNDCIDSGVDGISIRNMRDDSVAQVLGYGVEISGASNNISINGCTFRRCRHGVTTGTAGGGLTPNYGVQRGISISGCVAMNCSHVSFDTHEDTESITYNGCSVIGGRIAGYQARAYSTTINGCNAHSILGNGIYMDSSGRKLSVSGGIISKCRKTGNTTSDRGHGLYLTGNTIIVSGVQATECDNFGLLVDGEAGKDLNITGSQFVDNGVSKSSAWTYTAGMHILSGLNRAVIVGNNASDSRVTKLQDYGLWLADGTITEYTPVNISDNNFSNNNLAPVLDQNTATPLRSLVMQGNAPANTPGGVYLQSTTTGSIAATTQTEVTVSLGFTAPSTDYRVTHTVVGTDLELRNITSKSVSNYKVMVYNRGAGAQTGTIESRIDVRK